ncbi:MAG: hypothetical protein OXT69_11450 [Candidatus Poribacteria bacterium]|nr:hypothetical protein [Candidatus Poribacteria bacterium]
MNGFKKILLWAAILILGYFALQKVAAIIFGTLTLLWYLALLIFWAAVLLGVVSLIRVLYRKTQEK